MNIGFGVVLWGDVLIGITAFIAGGIFGPGLWAKAKALIGMS